MAQLSSKKDHNPGRSIEIADKKVDVCLHELLDHCSYLYQEAFNANTELAIVREVSEATTDYDRDVLCAGCFFSFVQLTLTESCFMNCARLFDGNSTISIGSLLEEASSHLAEIESSAVSIYDGRPDFVESKSIAHPLAQDEERFYPKEVETQRSFEDIFDAPHKEVRVHITAQDLINLWNKRLNGLKKLTDVLRKHRNKIFAHSDIEALNYDEFVKRLPLTYGEIQKLIDFALDLTIELMGIISNVQKPRLPVNYNDIQGLLNYVNAGMEAVEKRFADS